jgi:hypothetical protein
VTALCLTAWSPAPAAVGAGTDEDLTRLWRGYLKAPDSYDAVARDLDAFGERAYPLILGEMRRCRASRDRDRCYYVDRLIDRFAVLPPFAMEAWEAIARSPRASREVRDGAASNLIRRGHPYGLVVLRERLQAGLSLADKRRDPPTAPGRDRWGPSGDVEASYTIRDIGRYGAAAIDTGPMLARFVQARGLEEARVAAAAAIGKVGYAAGAPVLLAQAPDFEDNWRLAYETAESLGRLGAGETQLAALARDHWYRPVRNNAERALNLIRTGAFARPGVEHDGALSRLAGSPLHYRGDLEGADAVCAAAGVQAYEPVEPRVVWPDRNAGVVSLNFPSPTLANRQRFILTLGARRLVGTNEGEWGGGVGVVEANAKTRPLISDNAIAVFPFGDGLLVVTGLAHMGSDRGDAWVVALDDKGPRVRRRIRLPAHPTAFKLAWPRTLIVTAGGEDMAITPEGRLVDAAGIEGCGAPSAAPN